MNYLGQIGMHGRASHRIDECSDHRKNAVYELDNNQNINNIQVNR